MSAIESRLQPQLLLPPILADGSFPRPYDMFRIAALRWALYEELINMEVQSNYHDNLSLDYLLLPDLFPSSPLIPATRYILDSDIYFADFHYFYE